MGHCIQADWNKDMDPGVRFHRFRYHLARGFIGKDDVVLDVGSGGGYGTGLISEVASRVIGIERVKSEVDSAINKYQKDNNEFICANLEDFNLPMVDVACAFEVIEHLYEPKEFVDKLKSSVRKFIIFSVPIGQELIWNEETEEYNERGDTTHKSVFPTDLDIKCLFADWTEFYSFRQGVTLICVYYNPNLEYGIK